MVPQVEGPETTGADVVVIGSGAAGLMAAIEAADGGAKVVVLESEAETGGSTRISGAYVALCETPLQPGSRAELLADLRASHHHDDQQDLSQVYVEEAPATYRRLAELGVNFVRTFQFAHMSRPWAHELSGETMSGGTEIVTQLLAAAAGRGIAVLTGMRATRLAFSGGRVTGVEATGPRGPVAVGAKGGVIIATGGFTRNPDLVRTFGRPGSERIFPLTGIGSRGDGLKLGMSAGAGLSYIGIGVAPTAPSNPDTGKGVMVIYAGAVILNRWGKRFCCESDSYVDVCWAALRQPEARFVQVFDQAIRAEYATSMMGKVLTGFREISADTLEELVALMESEFGIDRAAALASIGRYNSDVRAGAPDEFGRTHLVGTSGALRAISEPPFHAVECVPGTTHFNGGLAIDAGMRVIDVFGQPIPGLFAAGEVAGGFHGAGYMSGSFVGFALISGRVAGRNAAAGPGAGAP